MAKQECVPSIGVDHSAGSAAVSIRRDLVRAAAFFVHSVHQRDTEDLGDEPGDVGSDSDHRLVRLPSRAQGFASR